MSKRVRNRLFKLTDEQLRIMEPKAFNDIKNELHTLSGLSNTKKLESLAISHLRGALGETEMFDWYGYCCILNKDHSYAKVSSSKDKNGNIQQIIKSTYFYPCYKKVRRMMDSYWNSVETALMSSSMIPSFQNIFYKNTSYGISFPFSNKIRKIFDPLLSKIKKYVTPSKKI